MCARARPGRLIHLDLETKKDLEWWMQFCAVFNCKSLIPAKINDLCMVSDASKRGFGAWCGSDFFYGFWGPVKKYAQDAQHLEHPPLLDRIDVHEGNINVYELWPVVVGLKRWGHAYANSMVNIVTDNMQVLAMVNTGRSKNNLCMEWLRELYWTCFINNIDLFATYIRSADNILADQLSRLAYRGYTDKCNITLAENKMTCLSLQ